MNFGKPGKKNLNGPGRAHRTVCATESPRAGPKLFRGPRRPLIILSPPDPGLRLLRPCQDSGRKESWYGTLANHWPRPGQVTGTCSAEFGLSESLPRADSTENGAMFPGNPPPFSEFVTITGHCPVNFSEAVHRPSTGFEKERYETPLRCALFIRSYHTAGQRKFYVLRIAAGDKYVAGLWVMSRFGGIPQSYPETETERKGQFLKKWDTNGKS
eukprot:746829-Hanusia_phi.AAC.1